MQKSEIILHFVIIKDTSLIASTGRLKNYPLCGVKTCFASGITARNQCLILLLHLVEISFCDLNRATAIFKLVRKEGEKAKDLAGLQPAIS